MPAHSNPPSEKLTKLRLFSEKLKTDFIAENSELVSWMQDRNLAVDQLSFPAVIDQSTLEKLDSAEAQVFEKISTRQSSDTQLASSVTLEEYNSIMEKMVELLHLPAGQLQEDSELYLEQQLSDILGFDVVANLDNQRLLYSTGIMQAEPHLKRTPTDSLEKHTSFSEAGIHRNRSAFGWFSSTSQLDSKAVELEQYYVSVPLYYHDDWNIRYSELKKWYKFKKVVVLNPAEQIAVVAKIGNIGPTTITRRQFGGSPELIHAGKIWSPSSAGRVLILFVNDPEDTVPLGPILLHKLFETKNNE